MGQEIEVEVNIPETNAEPVVTTGEAVADTVIEKAIELADVIDDARKEGERESKWEKSMTDEQFATIMSRFDSLFERVEVVIGQINFMADELATLSAIEVAEIVEENTPAEVEAIAQTADEIKEEVPDVEVNLPTPRKSSKVNWI